MRFAALALALSLGGCFNDEPRTIELDTDEVRLPMGAGSEIAVWVDGFQLTQLGAGFSWVVDDPTLVSVAITPDHAHVRITGKREGHTTVHIGYRTSVTDLPTTIMPPAVLGLVLQPVDVTAPVGAMVPVHAMATYTTGETRDVTSSTVWVIDDPSIATIEAAGVRATGAGTTTLHAIVDGAERNATVTVAP